MTERNRKGVEDIFGCTCYCEQLSGKCRICRVTTLLDDVEREATCTREDKVLHMTENYFNLKVEQAIRAGAWEAFRKWKSYWSDRSIKIEVDAIVAKLTGENK